MFEDEVVTLLVAVVNVELTDVEPQLLLPVVGSKSGGSRYDKSSMGSTLSGNNWKRITQLKFLKFIF